MGLQSTVNIFNAAGVPGDLAFSGPIRSQVANINSNGAEPNTIGFAYTITSQANPNPSGAAPLTKKVIADQQELANRFSELKIIPKSINIQQAVWAGK